MCEYQTSNNSQNNEIDYFLKNIVSIGLVTFKDLFFFCYLCWCFEAIVVVKDWISRLRLCIVWLTFASTYFVFLADERTTSNLCLTFNKSTYALIWVPGSYVLFGNLTQIFSTHSQTVFYFLVMNSPSSKSIAFHKF